MKKIELHKIDLPYIIEENYDWLKNKIDKSVDKSKQTFRFLFYVYRDSVALLQMAVTEKPQLLLQKHWFYLWIKLH